MIIEQNTNYAYKLKYMDNPTFDKVRDLSTKFYRELPQALQDELFEALNHGIDILDSEPQMTAYLFAFGKMHQAKLNYAFGKLPEEFLEQPEINIIDYGCGQALGTMCYADFLRENGYTQKVKTITLIEPSEICLKRAALHVSVFFPNAEIRLINKTFDELENDDISCVEDMSTLHVLSNVLDVLDFDLESLVKVIDYNIYGRNQFVCVGPYFNYPKKDDRMEEFGSLLKGYGYYWESFDKNEFAENKIWTAQILCFSIELSTWVENEDMENAIDDGNGVLYSRDFRRLLICRNHDIKECCIKEGTKIICDDAFGNYNYNVWEYFGEKCLRRVFIPSSVKSIGEGAFMNCESLQEIAIPDSVTSIGDHAFEGCKSLLQVKIPNTVTNIGPSAFENCESLQEITIPNKLTRIEACVFEGCKSLHQVNLPNSVLHIGWHAFKDCESLREITIPNSVEAIEDCAFEGCKSLLQVAIPKSVTSIAPYTFKYCESLKQITIPNTITKIEVEAFNGCESLQQIRLPSSLENIGTGVFNNCYNLEIFNLPTFISVYDQMLIDTRDHSVISYYGNKAIICIPDTVASIDCAFVGCKYLHKIILPDSVTSIFYSFKDCESLQEVVIPNSMEAIEDWAFEGCKSLHKIEFPDSLKTIGRFAFSGCKSLLQVKIPNTVTNIGQSAFEDCESLQEITIPNKLTIIEASVFKGCKSLHQVNLPNSVLQIGGQAFKDCESLREITIPNSVTSIEDCAFCNSALQKINIPKSINSIGDGAFSNCLALHTIINDSSFYAIKNNMLIDLNSNSLLVCVGNEESVFIPDSIRKIATCAFCGQNFITQIVISESNTSTSIEKWAFRDCISLLKISLPNSVTKIEHFPHSEPFVGCSSLQQIIIPRGSRSRFEKMLVDRTIVDKLVEK